VDSATAAAALAALGHSLRLEVWRILVPHGSLGLSAGVIAARLAVAPSSLSFHLHQMTQSRILVQRRSSRQTIYAVDDEMVKALWGFLGVGEMIQLSSAASSHSASGQYLE
jgi:ArsR family transcriptional regulator, arsenate/arsenite/antimonite-responsive transcriptional repressor